MTTTDPPAPRAGSLTIARPSRPSPAILTREVQIIAGANVEIDVLGVDGVYLDATLERVRSLLERFAGVVGRDVTLIPVGHPDAPSGYMVAGLTLDEVDRAIVATVGLSIPPPGRTSIGHLLALDIEGRW